jgi:hypothetical protein
MTRFGIMFCRHNLPEPLFGLLAGGNGLITLLFGLLPCYTILVQLTLDRLPLILGPPENLLVGDLLMGDLGFECLDRRLRLFKLPFSLFPCCDLFPESLTRSFELIGTDKAATVGTCCLRQG